ncbi:MAG: hypothetical protein QXR01_03860 [Candidatus Bathyarchaeia archaeon]
MTVFFGVLLFIVFTFLPSIIELKRPKDPGPRVIKEYDLISLHDLDMKKVWEENEVKVNLSAFKEVGAILAFLPDLEHS